MSAWYRPPPTKSVTVRKFCMAQTPHIVAVEATSRSRKCGHETPQLRLERRLHARSPYRCSDLVSAGPGGNPNKGTQVPWLPPDPNEEEHLEIFSPPYLFKGPRPVIDDAPEEVHYGVTITVRTHQAGEIRWVSLIRSGLTTHSFNVEQRLVDVPFQTGTNTLQAAITNEPNLSTSQILAVERVAGDGELKHFSENDLCSLQFSRRDLCASPPAP